MLKYNLNSTLDNLDDVPYKDGDGLVTLGNLAETMLTVIPKDKPDSAANKVKFARMALKVHQSNGVIELSPEDVTLLKARIGEYCQHNILVMRAHDLLDGGAVLQEVDEAPKEEVS